MPLGGRVGLDESLGNHGCMLEMMRASHSIRAAMSVLVPVAALTIGPPVHAQVRTSTFKVVVRGTPVGAEDVSVERTAQGWTIASSGRVGPPLDVVLRRLQLRYDADWRPVELTLDATLRGQATAVHTAVQGTTATTDVTPLNASPVVTTAEIDARAVLLPSPYIAPYEALAARLHTELPGADIALYQPGVASGRVRVVESSAVNIQTLNGLVHAKRTKVELVSAGAPPLGFEVWGDENGRLLRVAIPAQAVEFVREDLGSVVARIVTMARPNDEDVRIPANGFLLAGTLSKPLDAKGPLPAVVLLSGAGATDRDETLAGIPIFGQLAEAMADAGFVVLRYDKRGSGQSGGRPDAAALADFADDAKAAVKFMSERKDVDRKRIAVVGHSEGGWIALLTAAKNGRVAAVGLVSTVGVSGRELNLYQVSHGLERSNRTEEERQATLDLQKKIQDAVVSGKGWEAINVSPAVRRQADTPYFQSFLTLDPARTMKDLDQPILVVHGELDTQVPPSNADALQAQAKARKKGTVDVVKVAGVNHLLVPAQTGERDEYGNLPDHTISPAVTSALVSWLQKTMPGR